MTKTALGVFELKVHPAADVFPMLADDELNELAEDIKANGLHQSIVVKDGVLIDGRNRREACRRAGVEPRVEELVNGTDPVSYILATNVNRRHLTKGQRAMAVAKLTPDVQHGGARTKAARASSEKELGVSVGKVSEARTVLKWLPEIADCVMAGTKPLNEAYQEAQAVKAGQDSEVTRLTKLRERSPDLADLVDEGRMRLTEAESAWGTRQEDARRHRQATLEVIDWMERMQGHLETGARRADFLECLTEPGDRKRARAVLAQWGEDISGTLWELK